jgi:hypothetical protein
VDGVVRAGFTLDVDFGLPHGSQANRFTGGDIVQLKLGMTLPPNTFTENSFDFMDATGTYKSAAHIQQTTIGGSSGWIGADPPVVPEPSTWLAGALLLLPFGLGALRTIRKSRTKAQE